MDELLYIDATVRKEASRTRRVADAFVTDWARQEALWVHTIRLADTPLTPLVGESFTTREALLLEKRLDHPRFAHARRFARANHIVIAAPFWDLSFPAILKLYIETISVDGITFETDETGLHGLARASELIYITTRGGHYEDSPLEMGVRQIKALATFYGIDRVHTFAADGLDIVGVDVEARLRELNQALASYLASRTA